MVIFQHYAWKSQPEWLKICFRSLILISILTSYLSYWYMYLPIFNRQNWDTKICSRPTIMPLEIGKSIDHVLYDRIHGLYFYLIISAHCPNCLMWEFEQVFLKCRKACTKSTVRRDMWQVCSKLISKLMEQYYWRFQLPLLLNLNSSIQSSDLALFQLLQAFLSLREQEKTYNTTYEINRDQRLNSHKKNVVNVSIWDASQ